MIDVVKRLGQSSKEKERKIEKRNRNKNKKRKKKKEGKKEKLLKFITTTVTKSNKPNKKLRPFANKPTFLLLL